MRTLPVAGLALLTLALFGNTGVFSPQITKALGNDTLIRSPTCGCISLKDPSSSMSQLAYNSRDLSDTLPVAEYERACYDKAENSLQYDQFIQRRHRWA